MIVASLVILTGCNPSSTSSGKSDEPKKLSSPAGLASEGSVPSVVEEQEDGSVFIQGSLSGVDWRSLVNREVVIDGDLVIVDTYDLIRRGQVKVARDRLVIPTSRIDPNDSDPNQNTYEGGSNTAEVATAQKFNDTATIILDDGSAEQNVFPPTLFPELGASLPTVRIGSVVSGVKGRLVEAGSVLLLVVDGELEWTPALRPERPEVGAPKLTVASFNVLNYFTTIDDGANNARGADSSAEFERQEAKIVAAIQALDADVIGLMEIENNMQAERQLIDALNRAAGSEAYQGVGIPTDFAGSPGSGDAIRVGIIYRTDRVQPIGEATVVQDPAFSMARTPVVQSFQAGPEGKPFTVIVNHFKSKGGADRADAENKNKGDGQSAYNAARRAQSLALAAYIRSQGEAARVMIIGDLNAYQQEDPIDALRASGMVDLHEKFAVSSADTPYSYVYYGQSGSLDHALATEALAKDVTGVATWHINADEPRFLDYNQEYNPQSLYQPDAFRSSDHDPVVIGLSR